MKTKMSERLTATITGMQPDVMAILTRAPQPQPGGAKQNMERATSSHSA